MFYTGGYLLLIPAVSIALLRMSSPRLRTPRPNSPRLLLPFFEGLLWARRGIGMFYMGGCLLFIRESLSLISECLRPVFARLVPTRTVSFYLSLKVSSGQGEGVACFIRGGIYCLSGGLYRLSAGVFAP